MPIKIFDITSNRIELRGVFFLILYSLISCGKQNDPNQGGKGSDSSSVPAQELLINMVSGDTIRPIINSLGDTVPTGVPIPTKGKLIQSDSVSIPRIIPVGRPTAAHTDLNAFKVEETNIVMVTSFNPKPPTDKTLLINSIGDTIETGVPIPVVGKRVAVDRPTPVPALTPRFRDNVINNMQYLDVDQGMNSSYVNALLEDSSGNLWIGNSGGVTRYNGETFSHFGTSEGLRSNSVETIFEDKAGNVWFGTWDGGVTKYDGAYFTQFGEEEGLGNSYVLSILEDKKGNLWFGTNGGGVSKFDGNTFTHFTTNEGLSHNSVRSILEDRNGKLWFGTNGGGVCVFDGDIFTHKQGLKGTSVTSMLQDDTGDIWIGTAKNGVSRYTMESKDGKELETFAHFTKKEGLSHNNVMSMYQDNDGQLWFGTDGGGVTKFNGSYFIHYTVEEGLSHNSISSIWEGKNGVIWFGTFGGGLNIFHRYSFNHITTEQGLSTNVVLSILEDKEGNLWFGTYNGGIARYNGEGFTYFTVEQGFSDNMFAAMLEDKEGNLWFGTLGSGVYKYDGKIFTHFTEENGLSSNTVRAILQDKAGKIWFGTAGGGISMYDGARFTHFTERHGLSDDDILSILEDSIGNLWFGTYRGGVSKYIPGSMDGTTPATFTNYSKKEGLSSNTIRSMAEDSQGNLWFGTGALGISAYKPKDDDSSSLMNITYITEKQGLVNNDVWSVVVDKQNTIWAATESGISQLILDHESNDKATADRGYVPGFVNQENITIYNFGKQEGLKGIDFYPNSVLIDKKNQIWWGSGKALEMLDLSTFKIDRTPPVVQLDWLEINGKFLDYRRIADSTRTKIGFDSVKRWQNYPLNLELDHDQNHLTFNFSAIDWQAPHELKYRFKLEGIDRGWNALSENSIADYRNLPPGRYTFILRAIGSAQIWSTPYEYSFVIHPPWWLAWYTLTLYTLLGALFFFFSVNFGFKWVKSESVRKLRIVQLESKALRAQMNPHFISNALSGIQSVMLLRGEKVANKYFGFFSKLLRLTLLMSNSEDILLRDEIDYLRSYLELEKLRLNDNLKITFDIDSKLDVDHTFIPCMLFQPVVENAVLHGLWPKKMDREIIISFRKQEDVLVGTITDNGIGRDAAKKKKLKQKYRSWATKIMNDRISLFNKLHKRKINFKISDLKNGNLALGTQVILKIPIN